MAINFLTVKNNLYDWAVTVVPMGMPIIYWEVNAPRPVIPYVTLQISQVTAVNQDYSAPDSDSSGNIFMKGDRQFTLAVQSYGGDSLTVMENLRTSLQKQTVLDTLRANGIVFYQSLTINDITDLVDSKYESRSQLDILFGIGQVYADSPGFFDEIEVEEVFINALGVVVYDETLTISAP